MRLNPAAFNAFLSGNIGQDVLWRPSTMCPCFNPISGAAYTGCPKCGGKGWIWSAAQACRVGVSRQAVKASLTHQFNWEAGDAMLTVDESVPMYEASRPDRITMLNSTDRFSLAMTRGDPTERIWTRVEKIDRVYWFTGPNGQGDVVEGSAPTVDDETGVLTWGDGAPPPGKQYSITGTRFSEYFIYLELPSDRNQHGGARLPKKMMAKRFDVFGR